VKLFSSIRLNGTFIIKFTALREPGVGLILRNDCQDVYLANADIVKDAQIIDTKPVLRASQSSKSLDSAPA
jgi:hypothetical protein